MVVVISELPLPQSPRAKLFICVKISEHVKHISCEWFCTKTRHDTGKRKLKNGLLVSNGKNPSSSYCRSVKFSSEIYSTYYETVVICIF